MAIDEAILMARLAGLVPNTLRFYKWKPSAVSIGRFQEVNSEVNVRNCRNHGVDIVRRITGGGAVYHDQQGEITYSVIVDPRDFRSVDIVSTYNIICNGVVEAIRILGIKSDFNLGDPKHCPNITIDGRKLSGSAQHQKKGALLQHGTFLVDVDLNKMFTFLRVSWAKTLRDVLCVADERITSVKRELGFKPTLKNSHTALIHGFRKTLKNKLLDGELTDYELKFAEKLRRLKYSTNAWNIGGKSYRNA